MTLISIYEGENEAMSNLTSGNLISVNRKNRIRNICNFVLGILFITTTISGYYKDISYMSEYCFISGIIVGLILICSFIYYLNQ